MAGVGGELCYQVFDGSEINADGVFVVHGTSGADNGQELKVRCAYLGARQILYFDLANLGVVMYYPPVYGGHKAGFFS